MSAPTAPAPGPRRNPVAEILAAGGKILTADQEVALGRLWRDDPDHREAIEAAVVERNRGLVGRMLRRFRPPPGLTYEDMEQEGLMGLLHAWRKWDPERGLKFSTYAHTWIYQRVQRSLSEQGMLVRPPVHFAERLRLLARAEQELSDLLGQAPTDAEVAERLGRPLAWVERTRQLGQGLHVISLDTPIDGTEDQTGHEVHASRADTEAEALATVESEEIRGWLAQLPERDRTIIVRRYGLDGGDRETLEEIGQRLGITRERVRQLAGEAEKRLREIAGAPPPPPRATPLRARVVEVVRELGGPPGQGSQRGFWAAVAERAEAPSAVSAAQAYRNYRRQQQAAATD